MKTDRPNGPAEAAHVAADVETNEREANAMESADRLIACRRHRRRTARRRRRGR